MITTESDSTLLAATKYIAKGWAVMPVKPNSKEPHFDLIRNGHLSATKEIDLVRFWLKMDPTLNLGISAVASKLVILDVDFRNGGAISWDASNTRIVRTPGGFHVYYRVNQDVRVKGELSQGIDVKYKGYVVAPPSTINGVKYEVVNHESVKPLPKEIEEQICRIKL